MLWKWYISHFRDFRDLKRPLEHHVVKKASKDYEMSDEETLEDQTPPRENTVGSIWSLRNFFAKKNLLGNREKEEANKTP